MNINLVFRQSASTGYTGSNWAKGAALTYLEMDANFKNLQSAILEIVSTYAPVNSPTFTGNPTGAFAQPPEVDIASASTMDVGGQNTRLLKVTGSSTITSLGTNYRGPAFLRFTGACTLTHNATTLVIPGAADITTQAGDSCIVVPKATTSGTFDGWRVDSFTGINRLPAQAGNSGKALVTNGTAAAWGTPAGTFVYSKKTANYTAVDHDYILADTTSGAFAVTLPATPADKTVVTIYDFGRSFNANPLTVNRNGSTIEGDASNFTADISDTEYTFIYDVNTWKIVKTLKYRNLLGSVLVGPAFANELSTIQIQISNYQNIGSWDVSVNSGTWTRTSNTIYWTLGAVSSGSEQKTITVTHNTVGGSTTETLSLSVLNVTTSLDSTPTIAITDYSSYTSNTDWSVS